MDLVIERIEGWARLTLDRPSKRNALDSALLAALADALAGLAADPAVRAVVLTGAGGHFAAGADIGEIEHKSAADGATDPRKTAWAGIRRFPKPIIAAVDGYALGGGFELALMADILVLSPRARLGLPETGLGLIPGAGGGQRLIARIGQARAMRMILLGEVIDAVTAQDWGIASYLIVDEAPDAYAQFAAQIAAQLAARAPLALMAAKRALLAAEDRALALTEERQAFESLLDSRDKQEGIAAFRAHRPAEFQGK